MVRRSTDGADDIAVSISDGGLLYVPRHGRQLGQLVAARLRANGAGELLRARGGHGNRHSSVVHGDGARIARLKLQLPVAPG